MAVSGFKDVAGNEMLADTATFKTVPTTPAAPQSFTATPGNGQVVLSWAAPADDGGAVITKYRVSNDNWVTDVDVDASDTTYTFTGLTPGTSYTFQLLAVNSVGDGAIASANATTFSSDASLSALDVSEGALSPVFDSDTYNYAVTIPNSVSSLTVTPTANHPAATILVDSNAVTSGDASDPIGLIAGDDTSITIKVTAQNGATCTYTVIVTRAPAVPTVVTGDATDIATFEATLNGEVTDDGNATVTERGFVYGLSPSPAMGDADVTKVVVGDGTGNFSTVISSLIDDTTYYVRAFAINSAGTSYGEDKDFTTLDYISRTFIDSATGITISGDLVHREAELTVTDMTLHPEGRCEACDAIRLKMSDKGFNMLVGKDISLSFDFKDTLTINFPVGSEYDGTTVTILHCVNGTLQTYTSLVTDGAATVTVTSLSPFSVFESVAADIPVTGDDAIHPLALYLMILCALGVCVLVFVRKSRWV